jgi:hypothetical protein
MFSGTASEKSPGVTLVDENEYELDWAQGLKKKKSILDIGTVPLCGHLDTL